MTAGGGGGSENESTPPRGRFEPFLPAVDLPTPLRWIVAIVMWPVVALGALVGGALGLVAASMAAVIAVLAVVGLVLGGTHAVVDWPAKDVVRGLLLAAALVGVAIWEERHSSMGATPHGKASTVMSYGRRFAFSVLVVVAVVAVYRATHQRQANEPWSVVPIALVGLLLGRAYLRTKKKLTLKNVTWWNAAVVLVGGAVILGTYGGYLDRKEQLLRRYCIYGSVSRAQLKGCLDHVTDASIKQRSTEAARYARGLTDACGPTAGPFCVDEEREGGSEANNQRTTLEAKAPTSGRPARAPRRNRTPTLRRSRRFVSTRAR